MLLLQQWALLASRVNMRARHRDTALISGSPGLCCETWCEGVRVKGQMRRKSFVVVHAGTANEREPFQSNQSAALKLASRARPVERTDSFSRSLASGDRLWFVLNKGVILPSTLPYLRYRPHEHSYYTYTATLLSD